MPSVRRQELHCYDMIKRIIIVFAAALSAMAVLAVEFDSVFVNRALRVDYIFSGIPAGDSMRCETSVADVSSLPHWAGRRHNLDKLPLKGNGNVTVTSLDGDTLYRTSFSSLFCEWMTLDEQCPTAFEHTVLIPFPKDSVNVELVLADARQNEISRCRFIVNPADELIAAKETSHITHHRYIHSGAVPEKAIDVAIISEGYTAEEMDSFYRHAQVAVEAIMAHEPFKSLKDRFNFVAVAAPSLDSGVSVPRLGDWKSTAVSSHFSTFHSDRYLTTRNIFRLNDLLAGIPYEHIIVLANTDEYGGGGIYNDYTLTAARHKLFRPLVVHEFGHSFAGLADEYFYEEDVMSDTYPLDVEPWEPNITTLVDFGGKWKELIPEGTPIPTDPADAVKYPIGLYEGGGYSFKGVYRPADQCRMRNNSYPSFCPACSAAITAIVNFYTEP